MLTWRPELRIFFVLFDDTCAQLMHCAEDVGCAAGSRAVKADVARTVRASYVRGSECTSFCNWVNLSLDVARLYLCKISLQ